MQPRTPTQPRDQNQQPGRVVLRSGTKRTENTENPSEGLAREREKGAAMVDDDIQKNPVSNNWFVYLAVVSYAERGLRSHLLLRGEQPEILTIYNLISMLHGSAIYVPRSLYAKRKEMLAKHADLVAGSSGFVVWLSDILEASLTTQIFGKPNCERLDVHRYAESLKRVVIVNEGVIRLVQCLSQNHVFGKKQAFKIVVDVGTGTTTIGLGIGAICLGLPWEVYAVMLAENIDGYRRWEEELVSDFQRCCGFPIVDQVLNRANGRFVHWLEHSCPRNTKSAYAFLFVNDSSLSSQKKLQAIVP
ncbi:hypothetical protein TEA_011592 [Camellia sinensis var. sinensis]|uniref:Uncharacterized protein n=1 Tax=Camellia sinensis var. sinensis TaxID=542762 RepID=A0A4S4EPD0_CAMSN|nr:hypothetical protein TEA_011592 [Camellia sinensis var. sinensis]